MGLIAYQCLGILVILYLLFRCSEVPALVSGDMRPAAKVIFAYFLLSTILNEIGFTSNGGFLDAQSGYYLLTWNIWFNLYFAYLTYRFTFKFKIPVMLIFSFFMELNIAVFLDFYGGAPYPTVMKTPLLLGINAVPYTALIFFFNMLFVIVFTKDIIRLVHRGSQWLKLYFVRLSSPISS